MRTIDKEENSGINGLDERCCAYQDTVCFLRQSYPIFSVMTYDKEQIRYAEHTILAKIVIGLGEDEPEWLGYNQCTDDTHGENIPGGLKSEFYTDKGCRYTAEIYPLCEGREEVGSPDRGRSLGGAVLHFHNDKREKIWFKLGAGKFSWMHVSPNTAMSGTDIDCGEASVYVEGKMIYITRNDRQIITAVRGNFDSVQLCQLDGSPGEYGKYIVLNSSSEDIYLDFGYGDTAAKALDMALKGGKNGEQKVRDYYTGLMASWKLNTPDKNLNDSFTHALLNVEYAWLKPLGWIESIQHWPTMWHMEQTAQEEWFGNYDRVKDCLRKQMQNAFDNGAIPDMCPGGERRRDWGGNNQFFLREVVHYVKMTGDTDFLREAEPYMEQALRQSINEYDAVGSGVMCWYRQIGNQEDMEATPGKGAATGAEGIKMLEEMAWTKKKLGKEAEAEQYTCLALSALEAWKRIIWKKDLGRPIWYEDETGSKHLETTYHGICYPIMYGYLDGFETYSALDHLRHRLSGEEGEIFQSNHFGDHCFTGVPTWGMQAGSDMQPFATMAYCAAGQNNRGIEPLKFVADRVCGPYQRGSWPETANELRFAYFSPSAAMYSQGMIEGVFGLNKDMTVGKTYISPAIPYTWPEAELTVPGHYVKYTRKGNQLDIFYDISDNTEKILNMCVPQCSSCSVLLNGSKIKAELVHSVGFACVSCSLGTESTGTVSVKYEPVTDEVKCDYVASAGDELQISVTGEARIIGIKDDSELFDSMELRKGRLICVLKRNLLDEYVNYGQFGLMNFCRRTFFVKVRSGSLEYFIPHTVVIIPPYRLAAELETSASGRLQVKCILDNNSRCVLKGPWTVALNGRIIGRKINKTVKEESSCELCFGFTRRELAEADVVYGINSLKLFGSLTFECNLNIPEKLVRRPLTQLELPPDSVKEPAYRSELGNLYARGCLIQNDGAYLRGFYDNDREFDFGDGIRIKANRKGFIPFNREKHPVARIDLEGLSMRKIYIVVSAFIDNQDVFSKIATVEAEAVKGDSLIRPVFCRDLYFPGDLDMGYSNEVVANFSSFSKECSRGRKIIFPKRSCDRDYEGILPPLYPERDFWCSGRTVETNGAVFNLVEIDFKNERAMKELRIIADTADSAGGIFAVAYC